MHLKSPTPNPRPPRRGFTLTELLVVIAIIAMLVAITSVAVVRALDTAKQTRMKVEVDQLDSAFKAYKEKHGSYPPFDWFGLQLNPRFRQHISQAFPRYNMGVPSSTPPYQNLKNDLDLTGITVGRRADQAVFFWLRGFSNDPLHPFVTPQGFQIVNGNVPTDASGNPVKASITSFFEFDESRLVGARRIANNVPVAVPEWKTNPLNDPVLPSYFPQGVSADLNGAPYLYFDAASYENDNPAVQYGWSTPDPPVPHRFNQKPTPAVDRMFANAGAAAPYWNDANGDGVPGADTDGDRLPDAETEDWANPDSFQIIAPGGDGTYGGLESPSTQVYPRLFPTFVVYDGSGPTILPLDSSAEDNVTNFCTQARMGSAKP